jgi:hypothetical protein
MNRSRDRLRSACPKMMRLIAISLFATCFLSFGNQCRADETLPIAVPANWGKTGLVRETILHWSRGADDFSMISALTGPFPEDRLKGVLSSDREHGRFISSETRSQCGLNVEHAQYRDDANRASPLIDVDAFLVGGTLFFVSYLHGGDTEEQSIQALMNRTCPLDLIWASPPTGWSSSNLRNGYLWRFSVTGGLPASHQVDFWIRSSLEPLTVASVLSQSPSTATSAAEKTRSWNSCGHEALEVSGIAGDDADVAFIDTATLVGTRLYLVNYEFPAHDRAIPAIRGILESLCGAAPMPTGWF